MVMNVNEKKDICPTFSAIVEQLDEYSLRQRQLQSCQDSVCDVDVNDDAPGELNGVSEFTSVNEVDDDKGCEVDDDSYDNAEAFSFDHNDDAYPAEDGFNISDQHLENNYEVSSIYSISDVVIDIFVAVLHKMQSPFLVNQNSVFCIEFMYLLE